ncbi:hypothetical protein DDE18_06350 [Nocardioides gansuensis]|uniref:Uncharacterized protein n=1 Tax=Nocardioides gansuensis TaxID=2138300 RepID=A0A2T8FDW6_9ACTN|nr:hypothetical protein DDE18_06350 [Nocardioides gansuensis]
MHAAFTLAIAALVGDSPLTVGLIALLGSALGSSWTTFHGGWGAATALEALLALLLAWRGLAGSGGWESVLARAAILICVVALVGALLTVMAAQVDQPGDGF